MKTKKLVLVVLFALGMLSASLISVAGYAGNDILPRQQKTADSTDQNGGGTIIPPIGH